LETISNHLLIVTLNLSFATYKNTSCSNEAKDSIENLSERGNKTPNHWVQKCLQNKFLCQ